MKLDCPSLSCGVLESVLLAIHQRVRSVTRENLHSDTALYEVVVFPQLPSKMIFKLFSCCFPDLVAFLPDDHKVLNMSSSCSDHWTFRSCHHSVCDFFFYQGWINQYPTAAVRFQASPAVFLQHCRNTDAPLHGRLHQFTCCLLQRSGLSPVQVLVIPRDLAEVCVLAGMLH